MDEEGDGGRKQGRREKTEMSVGTRCKEGKELWKRLRLGRDEGRTEGWREGGKEGAVCAGGGSKQNKAKREEGVETF